MKVDEAEATSAGGILLPSAAQVKSTQGVIAAAPKGGAKTLSEGDRVLYSKSNSNTRATYLLVPGLV